MEETNDIQHVEREENQVKAPDISNKPPLTELKQNLQDANSHHDTHVSRVNYWLDNLYVKGSAAAAKRPGRSSITPKLIRKQAEWRYASLSESFLSHEDLFTTEPVTFEDRKAAIQNGLILNNQFNTQLDKVGFIDEYVRAAVNEGSVVVKVGWDFWEEEQDVPNMVLQPITSPFKQQLIEQAATALIQGGSLENLPPDLAATVQLSLEAGAPVEFVQKGTKKEMVTIRNQPTVDVMDYATTVIDPLCKGDIDKAQFVTVEFETSRSELEKDGRYHNLDQIKLERSAAADPIANNSTHDEDRGSFNFNDEPRKKFIVTEYWGYWDLDGTGVVQPFVASWVGDTMIRLERSPYPDGKLPFVLVKYLPRRKDVYGEPDGELLIDNQQIAGAVTRGMIDLMGRSANGQIGYRKDALDVTNKRRFDAGKDYEFNTHIANPDQAFYHHDFPEIPNSAPFMLTLQNEEAEALTGVKAFHGGISGEGLGRSATAARSALDAAGKRELGILRRLAKGITDVGRKIIAMNGVFLSEEEVVRVTNEEFITVNRDDLAGNIDIKLKISTAEADDTKAQELAFMLQTTGPNGDPGEVRMIRAEIARLRKMPDLAKKIEEYQPQPDPMQIKIQELTIQELQMKIAKLESEVAENYAEANLDNAQARKTESEADLADLDFVEQETGTKHERDVDKVRAQSVGNIALEREKAANNPNGGNVNPNNARPS